MQSNRRASRFMGLVAAGALTLVVGSSLNEAKSQAPAQKAPAPAQQAPAQLDQQADRTLRAMSDYMAKLPQWSADYDTDVEYVMRTGEKIQLAASGNVEVKRPGSLHVVRRGGIADLEMFFNGKTFTIFGRGANTYAEKAIDGTIDQAIDTLRSDTGLELSGADLMASNVYAGLMNEVESSTYWGTTFVRGIECHYLTFRARGVDWQIWIQTGDKPLPMKYVITSKWMTGSPHYSISLWNWNTDRLIADNRFVFAPPSGVRKLEQLAVDENQDLVPGR